MNGVLRIRKFKLKPRSRCALMIRQLKTHRGGGGKLHRGVLIPYNTLWEHFCANSGHVISRWFPIEVLLQYTRFPTSVWAKKEGFELCLGVGTHDVKGRQGWFLKVQKLILVLWFTRVATS